MKEVVIGWTLSPKDRSYSNFFGYEPGRKQHEETLYLDTLLEGEALAEICFVALNKDPEMLAAGLEQEIHGAVSAAGYNGYVDDDDYYGHYSLSTGDTVTIDGVRYACGSWGWDRVKE